MSHYDRGSREPASETPLTMARAVNDRQSRRGGPAPVTLLVSLLLLALAAGGVFWLYRGGFRGPSGPPQTVGVPIHDVKVAAPPQPKPEDPAAGLSIYRDNGSTAPTTPAFTAPPEQPTPRPTPPAAAPSPSVSAPIRVAPQAASPPTIESLIKSATTSPAAKASTKPATPSKPTPGGSPAGGYRVQIGAFSSTMLAENGWIADASVAPGAMAGKGKKVETVNSGGATLYRTSITGFSSRAEATAFCAKLRAAGRSCFVP